VIEAADQGIDEVRTALQTYTLTANVENLTSATTTGQKLVGNDLDNIIRANSSLNTLIGRAGNDTYWIGNSATTIVEKAGEGFDTIRTTSTSFYLDIGISIEVLAAADESTTAALTLVGNEFANTLIGGDGNDYLEGRGGGDTLIGNGGNDRYLVDAEGITIVEAAGDGNDLILVGMDFSLPENVHVESISARDWSSTAPLTLSGNSIANVIVGNAGNNVLSGRGGVDTLQGREGADTFVFDVAPGPGNVDTIADFVSGTDKIALAAAVFGGLAAPGLPASAFVIGSQAVDADDRIIYNSATGSLLFDADGSGATAAIEFARLSGAPTLLHSDFLVI
jgi:Ca2+-binding RTX toxin-like protein